MVNIVEETISVDKQGRMVVPSHLREALGVKDGGQVSIRLDGPRLILEPVPTDIKERVSHWEHLARETKAEVSTEEEKDSWKWMTHEYARKKLGLY